MKDNFKSSKQLGEIIFRSVKGGADDTEQRASLRALKRCVARITVTVVTRPMGRESVAIIPRRGGADQDEADRPTCDWVAAVFKGG